MNMECKFDTSLLQALIDDNIEPLELIFLSEHLKVCKSCMDEVKMLYSIDQSLKSLFNEDNEYTDKLSSKTELVIDNLFAQLEEEKKLKDIVKDSAKLNGLIIENSSRFLEFIPGMPLLRRMGISYMRRMRISYKNRIMSYAIPHRRKSQ